MRRSLVGICLLAVLIGVAVGAQTAWAETGSVKFSGSQGGEAEYIHTQNVGITCSMARVAGEIKTATTGTAKLTLEHCKLLREWPCTTEGAAVGTIEAPLLGIELGALNESSTKFGVQFYGTPFAKFECQGQGLYRVRGAAIVAISAAPNEQLFGLKGRFQAGSQETQIPESFFGGSKVKLEAEINGKSGYPFVLADVPIESSFETSDHVEIGTVQSGNPEFGRCREKITAPRGKYTDANCTKKAVKTAEGKYEWYPVPN